MKKRAAIARALALESELIFLDEPSAGLDPITSAELDSLIQTLNRDLGVTVIMVTHELDSLLDGGNPLRAARPRDQGHHRRGPSPRALRPEPGSTRARLLSQARPA